MGEIVRSLIDTQYKDIAKSGYMPRFIVMGELSAQEFCRSMPSTDLGFTKITYAGCEVVVVPGFKDVIVLREYGFAHLRSGEIATGYI